MKQKKVQAQEQAPFWNYSKEDALVKASSSENGLTTSTANLAREKVGPNEIKTTGNKSKILQFIAQFKSPITLILIAAAILSFFLGDKTDAIIILIIIAFSTVLGFWQESSAGDAIAKLLSIIQIKTAVIRDGQTSEIPVSEVVPGDIVTLSAGDIVPADCLLLEEDELFIDEAAFTGETFPVEKDVAVLPVDTVLSKRSNSVFMGSHVVSGTAKALVMRTGSATEFGHISQSLKQKNPETAFEIGIRKFGYLLMQITLVMVILIFGANVLLHKPILDSLLFTLAIAVGLTPQLLPAIITVNLSKGAKRMAEKNVVVKKLNAIENFGSMNVLCSDKTGTLTEGKVRVHNGLDCFGNESCQVLEMAKINSTLQQGFKNPIDEAISQSLPDKTVNATRIDEIPYDFIRKRLSLLVDNGSNRTLITKGAVTQVLEACSMILNADGTTTPIEQASSQIQSVYESLSADGYRTLGVAYKDIDKGENVVSKDDESSMVFAGFVSLFDPPKEGIADTIKTLQEYGIELKVITGDNALIAKSMSVKLGLKDAIILTGGEMREMSDAALFNRVQATNVFAEIEPNQKERIILAVRKTGKTVGYMGDGINDVSAIHAADVGLSVNTAVDVAKAAADIVLLNQDLNVLIDGVKEGRRTFANTQKYIFMATSANFGNMFSMAGASMLLKFLPLLPKQILLTNLVTDLPSMTISTDNVNDDWIKQPRKWDIKFIKRFMVYFGLLSSIFDYITFGVLLFLLHAGEQEFQTGWFLESVVSATLIVLVVRTRKSFLKSRPSKYLVGASLSAVLLVLLFPYLPLASLMGFIPLPFHFYLAMIGIVVMYILSAEMLKRWFYRKTL